MSLVIKWEVQETVLMTTARVEERSVNIRHDSAGLRILIVEDGTDSADSMAVLLRLCGYEVEIAPTGLTALDKARTRVPDVVLLDLGLPEMNGCEVARRLIKQCGDKTPLLIAVTGYDGPEDRRRAQEAGIDLHLVKPVDLERLLSVLARVQKSLPCQPS